MAVGDVCSRISLAIPMTLAKTIYIYSTARHQFVDTPFCFSMEIAATNLFTDTVFVREGINVYYLDIFLGLKNEFCNPYSEASIKCVYKYSFYAIMIELS